MDHQFRNNRNQVNSCDNNPESSQRISPWEDPSWFSRTNFPLAQHSMHSSESSLLFKVTNQSVANSFATKSIVDEDNNKLMNNFVIMPSLERRGLKDLLVANPLFHLIEFNGMPKSIKTSIFIEDMMRSLPNIIKAENIISIHSQKSFVADDIIDYKIGFSNTHIISQLREILGSNSVELYNAVVQLVYPDLRQMESCEFVRVIDIDLLDIGIKNHFKLSHVYTNLFRVILMLEQICQEKFWSISAICCNGEQTFINLSDPILHSCLVKYANEFHYKIEQSDTASFTGRIPLELIQFENPCNTQNNNASTAKLTSEELVKRNGFKSLLNKYTARVNDSQLTSIQRSLLELRTFMNSRMSQVESKISHEIFPLKNSVLTLEKTVNRNTNTTSLMHSLLDNYVTEREDKKYWEQFETNISPSHDSSISEEAAELRCPSTRINRSGIAVNSSTYEITVDEEDNGRNLFVDKSHL